mgnify:CR=1 FL=1
MDNFMEYGWEDEIVNEGGDFVLLPEGDYDFTVAKYERARHEGSAKVPPCKGHIHHLGCRGQRGDNRELLPLQQV